MNRGKRGGWRAIFIYVPVKVFEDSSFPFEIGERVKITIDGERLLIEKCDKGEVKGREHEREFVEREFIVEEVVRY